MLMNTNGPQALLGPDDNVPASHALTRAQFMDRLGRELRRTKMSLSDRHAVLSVDVDRFRLVTASFGREAGDELLGAIACSVSGFLNRYDALARAGGDEFLILVEETRNGTTAAELAEKIQRDLIG
jgi:diguanylate cyclase (GGDEF)-like protein